MKKLLIILILILVSSCEVDLEEYSGWIIKEKRREPLGLNFIISDPNNHKNWKILIVQKYTYKKYNIGDTIK